jgi:sulfatase maturation enzyme AslB (radical SAM superfamily)
VSYGGVARIGAVNFRSGPPSEPSGASVGAAAAAPRVALRALETLGFQVAGTVCNLACAHCFVSCSPTNHTHGFLSLDIVREHLADAERLGVKEFCFTGGEPFLNPEMESILAAALAIGPATVLTNGLLLDRERCKRLRQLSEASRYSLDLRIALDGWDAATNDPIRGTGTFERILAGIRQAHRGGLNPVVTVTEVNERSSTPEGKQRFLDLLRGVGIERPRLKVLPVFHVGSEAARGGAYEDWQRLRDDEVTPDALEPLQCRSCRMVTSQGVWVCPILVNEPTAKMGERLADTLNAFAVSHSTCWTCHAYGALCRA